MIHERRTLNGDKVETIKIPLETPPEMLEKYAQDGYMAVFEHYLVLYRPRIPQDEAERYKAAVENLSKIDLSTALKTDLVAAIAATTEVISKEPVATEGITPKEITNEPLIKEGG